MKINNHRNDEHSLNDEDREEMNERMMNEQI
jgi:hypothetical protein